MLNHYQYTPYFLSKKKKRNVNQTSMETQMSYRKIFHYNKIKTKLDLPKQRSCLPTVSCHRDCEYYSEIKTITSSHFFNSIWGVQEIVPRCLWMISRFCPEVFYFVSSVSPSPPFLWPRLGWERPAKQGVYTIAPYKSCENVQYAYPCGGVIMNSPS